MSKQDWRKLQAYLSTGLTPEECCRLREENRKLYEMAIRTETSKQLKLNCTPPDQHTKIG